jgi:hypothetical protein
LFDSGAGQARFFKFNVPALLKCKRLLFISYRVKTVASTHFVKKVFNSHSQTCLTVQPTTIDKADTTANNEVSARPCYYRDGPGAKRALNVDSVYL